MGPGVGSYLSTGEGLDRDEGVEGDAGSSSYQEEAGQGGLAWHPGLAFIVHWRLVRRFRNCLVLIVPLHLNIESLEVVMKFSVICCQLPSGGESGDRSHWGHRASNMD